MSNHIFAQQNIYEIFIKMLAWTSSNHLQNAVALHCHLIVHVGVYWFHSFKDMIIWRTNLAWRDSGQASDRMLSTEWNGKNKSITLKIHPISKRRHFNNITWHIQYMIELDVASISDNFNLIKIFTENFTTKLHYDFFVF